MKKESKKKEDLLKDIEAKKLALRDMRFGVAGGKSKNVKEQKNLKKEIARIKTELRITN